MRLFFCCLIAGASYTLARTVGDSLFLARIGNENLAMVIAISGLLTAGTASLWFMLMKRFPLESFLRASTVSLGALTLAAWLLLPYLHHSLYFLAAVFVLAEIKGCINAIHAFTGMNEVLGGHSKRRSWAMVLLGFPIAAITTGFLVSIETGVLTVRTWLLVSAVLDLVAIAPTIGLAKSKVPKFTTAMPRVNDAGMPGPKQLSDRIATATLPLTKYVNSDTFSRWIGVVIAAKVFVLTIVSFEWKVTANDYYAHDEESLARYFGMFYAVAGVATLVVQYFVTGRLLAKKSVVAPIMILPATLFLLNILFVFGSGLAFLFFVATAAKAMDAWRRSTHDTAIHHLYTRVEKKKRRGLIGHNQAFVKPTAEVSAALVLALATPLVHKSILVVVSLVWLYATASLIGFLRRSRKANYARA